MKTSDLSQKFAIWLRYLCSGCFLILVACFQTGCKKQRVKSDLLETAHISGNTYGQIEFILVRETLSDDPDRPAPYKRIFTDPYEFFLNVHGKPRSSGENLSPAFQEDLKKFGLIQAYPDEQGLMKVPGRDSSV